MSATKRWSRAAEEARKQRLEELYRDAIWDRDTRLIGLVAGQLKQYAPSIVHK